MNKKELINKTVSVLKENNARKHVPQQKTTLHISDDNGQKKDFVIKKDSTDLLFTTKDVTEMFEAVTSIIEDSLRRGEEVNIHGFGTFSLKLRAARETKHPETGEVCVVKARYVPKFHFGNKLRMAAKIYELGLDAKEDDK